jgi:apolipoprotein N-acyltransferase
MIQHLSTFLNKQNWRKRLVELIILVIHLLLLKWILYVLFEGGALPIEIVIMHFMGLAVTGALLIRFCAWLYRRQYLKENNLRELPR